MNKKLAFVTLVICLVLGGLAAYGQYKRQQSLEPFWVDFPLSKVIESDVESIQIRDEYESLAKSDAVINGAVKNANLASSWNLSEAEAAKKLRGLIFVTIRTADKKTMIQIGVTGIRRDAEITKKANNALWTKLCEILTRQ